jgi:hypothetical protein
MLSASHPFAVSGTGMRNKVLKAQPHAADKLSGSKDVMVAA